MPTRLWSAVVSQLPMPVLADGRRMMPPSATAVAISSPSYYPGASSRIPSRSAQRLQEGHQGRDLVAREPQVGHDRARLLLRRVGEPEPQVLRVHVERVTG